MAFFRCNNPEASSSPRQVRAPNVAPVGAITAIPVGKLNPVWSLRAWSFLHSPKQTTRFSVQKVRLEQMPSNDTLKNKSGENDGDENS